MVDPYKEFALTTNILDAETIRLCAFFQYMDHNKEDLMLRIEKFWSTLEQHRDTIMTQAKGNANE